MRKLEAKDICRGQTTLGEQHCALGWIGAAVGSASKVAMVKKRLLALQDIDLVSQWNDKSDPQVVADALNQLFEDPAVVPFLKGDHVNG